MSLWEKWEREKLEKQGIKVEREDDVLILETHPKAKIKRQIGIVLGVCLACFALVYVALTFEAVFNGRRWSDTYIARLFSERETQRRGITSSTRR